MSLLPTLGARLRQRRHDKDLTQAALADQAGVSPRFLVALEKGEGNISVERLAAVCAVLDLPLEQLFRGLGPGGPAKLALVGMRGAGKSTIGAAAAGRLQIAFVELDRLVEEEAGMSLSEVFELRGEAGYRLIEGRVLDRALARPGAAILATGGSLVTAPDTWGRLRSRARTVWLQASPAAHLQRVLDQGDTRPTRGRPAARQELEALLAGRAPLYGQADHILHTEELGLEGTITALVSLLGG